LMLPSRAVLSCGSPGLRRRAGDFRAVLVEPTLFADSPEVLYQESALRALESSVDGGCQRSARFRGRFWQTIVASPVLRRHCRVLPQRSTEVSFASWPRSMRSRFFLARGKGFRGSETRHLATAHLASGARSAYRSLARAVTETKFRPLWILAKRP
jgi:hypothetical protein